MGMHVQSYEYTHHWKHKSTQGSRGWPITTLTTGFIEQIEPASDLILSNITPLIQVKRLEMSKVPYWDKLLNFKSDYQVFTVSEQHRRVEHHTQWNNKFI